MKDKKSRNINKDLYPSKWIDLISQYDENTAIELYWKFCRAFSLEKYILIHGEEIGTKLFNEKKNSINRGTTLEKMISKYGDAEGREKYSEWKKSVARKLENFILKYGEEEGSRRWEEYSRVRNENLVRSFRENITPEKKNTRLEYYLRITDGDLDLAKLLFRQRQSTSNIEAFIKKYGDKGTQKYEETCNKKSSSQLALKDVYDENGVSKRDEINKKIVYANSLERCVERYGEEEGKKKYQETNKKKSSSLKNFIRLYGEEEGAIRWNKLSQIRSYNSSVISYIEKYGEEAGRKKYRERILSAQTRSRSVISKISIIFFDELDSALKKKYNFKTFYASNEKKFYVESTERMAIQPDYYIEDLNLAVEFFGDYWHRNPSTYDDEASIKIRERDIRRLEELKNQHDCDNIIVWESSYKKGIVTADSVLQIIEEKIKCMKS